MVNSAKTVFRIVFGLVLLFWVWLGVTGFEPPPVAPQAEQFRDALFASPYLLPVVMIVYFIAGLAFLFNRYVALASVMLFPVTLNILLFHAFLNVNAASLSVAGGLLLSNCLMLYLFRDSYAAMLKSKP